MPKLSDLKGQNETVSGGILFNFDVQIKNIPADDEQKLYTELNRIFSRQLSAVSELLPSGVYLGILEMEDIDTVVEDDYDRYQDLNPNL